MEAVEIDGRQADDAGKISEQGLGGRIVAEDLRSEILRQDNVVVLQSGAQRLEVGQRGGDQRVAVDREGGIEQLEREGVAEALAITDHGHPTPGLRAVSLVAAKLAVPPVARDLAVEK